MKFKVGDRVIVKNTLDTRWVAPALIGKEGNITEVGKGYYMVLVGTKLWEAHQGELKKE
jgi:hypothetical protein